MPALFLLLASWLQPLHFQPWVSWHSEVLAFLAVLLLAWQAVLTKGKNSAGPTICIPLLGASLLGIGAIVSLQWLSGLVPFGGDVTTVWAYILLCVLGITIGFHSARSQPQFIVEMATVILTGAVLSAAIALAQAFELTRDIGWINSMREMRRPGANLAQPNQLATLLLMGLASLVFLFESRKFGLWPASLAAVLLLISLAATESRAGLLGFVVLNAWWFARRKQIGALLQPRALVVAAAMYAGLYWTWPLLMGEVFQLPGGALPANTVAYHRWIIWPQLWEAVQLRPWAGWGWGQISTAHNAVVDSHLISEPYTYAHNVLLDAALEFGLPITALVIGSLSFWGRRRASATRRLLPWYCLAVTLPVVTHSLVEFPYAYAYFLVPITFALGVLERELGAEPMIEIPAVPLGVGLAIASGLLALSSLEYVAIEDDFRIVRFEALRVGQTHPDYQRPNVHIFTQLDALLHGGRIQPKPGMSEQEIELARLVALRYPWPATQNRYALTLALNGNQSEATRQLRVMRALHGPKAYAKIREAWAQLGSGRYPELKNMQLPE